MTAHSGFPWKIGEPITDELVNEVATCTNANRMGYRFTPMAFAILGPVDGIIFNLGMVLDAWDYKTDFREFVSGIQDVPDWFVELAVRVLPKINLPPPPDERPKLKPIKKISIPKVNRTYPPLIAMIALMGLG